MPVEEHFAEDFGEALRRTGDTFEPENRSVLVDGALTRGRRRLARRRAAAVTGSVAALAAVAIGGAYGGGLWGSSGDGLSSVAASGPASGSVSPPPAPPEVVTGEDMNAILAGLLPGGKLSAAQGRGSDHRFGPLASGVFDDGKGKAAVEIALSRADGADAVSRVTCQAPSYAGERCADSKLADGSRLMIVQGYEYPDRRKDTKVWQAVLLTRDGFLVEANEYNAPAEKGAEVTRNDPPLSPERLRELVTSDKWREPMRLMPADPAGKGEGESDQKVVRGAGTVNSAEVLKAFTSLLPSGLTVKEQGGQDDYAYLVVSDGKGLSRVEINVQAGMNDLAQERFGAATTLPGGTKLLTNKSQGEKGVEGMVLWQADTLRPDGLRVVVFASNGAFQTGPATRATPALTMKQLTSIATSDRWQDLVRGGHQGAAGGL